MPWRLRLCFAAITTPRHCGGWLGLRVILGRSAGCWRAHAVVLLDQAGSHLSAKLTVPTNIILLPLPAKSPKLNRVENIWQFIPENWPSNRIFTSYRDILDHCCYAWNRLIDQPSIGLREWVHRS